MGQSANSESEHPDRVPYLWGVYSYAEHSGTDNSVKRALQFASLW